MNFCLLDKYGYSQVYVSSQTYRVRSFRSESKHCFSSTPLSFRCILTAWEPPRLLDMSDAKQKQDFLVLNGVEVRGATMLSHSQFGAIIERMYSGCTDPPLPPEPRSDDEKAQREQAVQVSNRVGIIDVSRFHRWCPLFQDGASKSGRPPSDC